MIRSGGGPLRFDEALPSSAFSYSARAASTYGVLREERLLIAYLSSMTGGPTEYVGRDMKAAHRRLGITASDWVFRAILGETLAALGIQDPERREVVDFGERLRAHIVQG